MNITNKIVRRELVKRWRQRLSALALITAILVLVDELVKEGYAFKLSDIFTPAITHEKIFLVLLTVGLVLGVRK